MAGAVASDMPLQTGLLDRLLGDDRGPQARGVQLADLRRAVRRDVEALLNTRQRCLSPPAGLDELQTSLVNYGIPDFTGMNLASAEHREAFRHAIEAVLRRFEPRFKRVSVVLLDNASGLDRTLRFRIDALMYADPDPQALVLDTELEPVNQTFHVKAARE